MSYYEDQENAWFDNDCVGDPFSTPRRKSNQRRKPQREEDNENLDTQHLQRW